ncbi:uncharacterized protein N7503_003666 [Penicillium pulvis]|uniref:uncharacterized protein n=1 Tax=Penicillium pulvis TaxID=1562058 RepID=UPI002546E5EC|nr:uncharacterized protein N7503_003666 [Penicillium pulvis]KAJ5806064.1 hypothetical protein N7503_003666 [Penicillium pulvis]
MALPGAFGSQDIIFPFFGCIRESDADFNIGTFCANPYTCNLVSRRLSADRREFLRPDAESISDLSSRAFGTSDSFPW